MSEKVLGIVILVAVLVAIVLGSLAMIRVIGLALLASGAHAIITRRVVSRQQHDSTPGLNLRGGGAVVYGVVLAIVGLAILYNARVLDEIFD